MYVTKQYTCGSCKRVFESVNWDLRAVQCSECAGTPNKAFAIRGCREFKPHYDFQLGEHFHTAKEKKAFLDKKGIQQVSGFDCPTVESRTNIYCSKDQAKKIKKKGTKVEKD